MPKKNKRIYYLSVLMVMAVVVFFLYQNGTFKSAEKTENPTPITTAGASENALTVSFLDVGQGAATLLSHDGAFALIDTGDTFADEKLLADLNAAGVKELDYLIISHPHSDHMANLDEVLTNYKVNTLVINDMEYESKMWNRALDTIESLDVSTLHPMAGETFSMGDVVFSVLNPTQDPNDYSETNDSSIVVKVSHGDDDFMFCGDATVSVENELIYQFGETLDIEVYGVSHHGSYLSNSPQFLEALTPEYYVISAGANNQYGHPDKETLDRIDALGGTVYRTDAEGTITMESSGNGISVK